jgi:hypothetical protein
MIDTITKNYLRGQFVSYQVTYVNSNKQLSVPLKEDNSDYQSIQKWIADGNTVIDNPSQENN